MRILHVTSHLRVGGIGTYVTTLARAQSRRSHHVCVASAGGALAPSLDEAGVLRWQMDLRVKSELHPAVWRAAGRLHAWLRQTPVDVIHAHTRVAQVAAALVSGSSRIPYVTTCHGFFRPRLGRRLFPCWGRAVIAVSRPVERHLLADFHVPPARVRLVPTGIDTARAGRQVTPEEQAPWRQALAAAPGDRLAVVMTRLVPSKGVEHFLRALAEARRHLPGLRGIVIGDGADKHRLEHLAQQLGVARRVLFTGTVEDPAPLLSLGHLFIFPATGLEGLGLSILEAMAVGLPVVATNVGGVSDVVEHGYSGFLVPPGDVAALAERMAQLAEHRSLAERLGAGARAAVADKFSLERMVEQVEAVYREAAACP